MPQNTRTTLRSLKSKIKSRRKTLVIHSKAPALDVYERMEFNGQIQALRWAEKAIDNMLREAKEE